MSPDQLGRTLTHEHFSLDFDYFYNAPPAHLDAYLNTDEIRLDTVGFLRQYPYGSRYNVRFCDSDTHQKVLDDVALYRKWGGGTIVENSSHGLKRNLPFLVEVARSTGVHVVAGTGHYVYNTHEPDVLSLSVEQMVSVYRTELTEGCAGSGGDVKCGFIGEVGSGWPIHGRRFYIFVAPKCC